VRKIATGPDASAEPRLLCDTWHRNNDASLHIIDTSTPLHATESGRRTPTPCHPTTRRATRRQQRPRTCRRPRFTRCTNLAASDGCSRRKSGRSDDGDLHVPGTTMCGHPTRDKSTATPQAQQKSDDVCVCVCVCETGNTHGYRKQAHSETVRMQQPTRHLSKTV
jgi:hypothetical protein